jgi:glycosyltransferase involved in cell wall biosynthesis
MHVLHLYAGNLFGGIERMLLALWRGRTASGDALRHHFALCFDGKLAEELRADGAPVTIIGPLHATRFWQVSAARRRVRQLILSQRVDVVLAHGLWVHGLLGPEVRKRTVPLALWVHDVPVGGGRLEQRASRIHPDLLIANSRFTLSAAGSLFDGVSSVIQHPMIEFSPVPDRAAARQQVRRSLATREDAAVIVQVSRMQPSKGHSVLLRALAKLQWGDSWECWIAGAPQRPQEEAYFAGLQELADELGVAPRVRFLGFCEDTSSLLAAADVFCQPNTEPEGFGVSFVEALAAGVPVVTSDLGAALEIIDKGCGRLVPAGDVESLGAQLDVLLNDPQLRASLSQAALQRGRELCDVPASVAALRAALGSVVTVPA